MKHYRCDTLNCRREPMLFHQPLNRSFCQTCWDRHCAEEVEREAGESKQEEALDRRGETK